MHKAVFLDRDGVLNRMVRRCHGFDSPYSLDEFELFPWVPEAVGAIKDMGYLAIVTSNQPGVAKGFCTPQFLERLNDEMQSHLEPLGVQFDRIYYCYHHPEGVVEPYAGPCDCRKPAPGMLQRAAEELEVDLSSSFMVGDSPKDVAAGRAAGCRTIFLGWQEHHSEDLKKGFSPEPHVMVPDLLQAVRHIQLATGRGGSNGNLHR